MELTLVYQQLSGCFCPLPAARSECRENTRLPGISASMTLVTRVTWSAMKCASADIRSRFTERMAATGRSPIQTLKKPSAFSVSAKHSKRKKLRMPSFNAAQRTDFSASWVCG